METDKSVKKTCEFCSLTFIDATEYNQTACDRQDCREKYVESVHGDPKIVKQCRFCSEDYHPDDIFDKDYCWKQVCRERYHTDIDHPEAVAKFYEACSAVYEAFKASPLAKLPNEFGSENVDIAFHRYILAGLKHHNAGSAKSDDVIDELIMWQPEPYLATQTAGRIWGISSIFSYFKNVVNTPGVPWVKPLYAELAKSEPIEPVSTQPMQLLLEI